MMIFTVSLKVVSSRAIRLFTPEELAADSDRKNPGPDDPHFEGSIMVMTQQNAKGEKVMMEALQNFKSMDLIPRGEHTAEILIGAYGGTKGAANYVRVLKILKTKGERV
ncbi:MAG: hypothetical protein EOP04_32330 [Proteobacteria bacterium]|nr:MAG: hypothetical protein EOP04_32330 [Pseudomonadota bacterium]